MEVERISDSLFNLSLISIRNSYNSVDTSSTKVKLPSKLVSTSLIDSDILATLNNSCDSLSCICYITIENSKLIRLNISTYSKLKKSRSSYIVRLSYHTCISSRDRVVLNAVARKCKCEQTLCVSVVTTTIGNMPHNRLGSSEPEYTLLELTSR